MCMKPQSPKDDLESLVYIFIFLFRGLLPWSVGGGSDVECYSSELTLKMKLSLPIEIICKDMPSEFARHLKYARSLKYGDTPDYSKLRDMYRRLMKRMGHQYDGVYDWDLKNRKSNDMKQPSGDIVPASIQDEPLTQDKAVPQSNPLIQDTPLVQDKSLVQDESLIQETPLVQVNSLVQDKSLVQNESLIPETPLIQNKSLVQDKPLDQASPSTQGKPLKRKKGEEDDEEKVTQPTKKRKIIFHKAAHKKQPTTKKRRGRPPKAQIK